MIFSLTANKYNQFTQSFKNLTMNIQIYLSIIFSMFFFSCNGSNDNGERSSTSQSVSQSEEGEEQGATLLQQNGDYSALFNRDQEDCQVLSIQEMAEVLAVPVSSVTNEDNGLNSCNYFVGPDENNTRFYFSVIPWGREMILKEIETAKENAETFGPDSKLSQYRMSETGDTYLSMHQNRTIRILNENYDNAILILYQPKIAPDESDIEKINRLKTAARENTFSIANFLLEKYKE